MVDWIDILVIMFTAVFFFNFREDWEDDKILHAVDPATTEKRSVETISRAKRSKVRGRQTLKSLQPNSQ